jgi:hypothetical protein
MKVTIEIADKNLFEVIRFADIRYWAKNEGVTDECLMAIISGDTTANWILSEFDEATGEITHSHILKHDGLKNALRLMQESYPDHFADLLRNHTDCMTGDVLVQLWALKDVQYG